MQNRGEEVGIVGRGQQGLWAEVGAGTASDFVDGGRVSTGRGRGQGFQERGSCLHPHPPPSSRAPPHLCTFFPVPCLPPWKCCLLSGVTAPHPVNTPWAASFLCGLQRAVVSPRGQTSLGAWSPAATTQESAPRPRASHLPHPSLPALSMHVAFYSFFFSSSPVEGLFLFPDGSHPGV